jgi:hypothetical protein
LRLIKVYWNCLRQDGLSHLEQIRSLSNALNRRKGQLHKSLIDKQKNAKVPDLMFVYDEYEDQQQAVAQLLDQIRPDLQEKAPFDARQFVPPSKLISDAFVNIKPKHFKKQLTLYDEQEATEQQFAYEKKQSALLGNERVEFECPPDMRLNAANLDYRTLINRVLFYLSRTRAEITQNNSHMKATSHWVPPIQSNADNRVAPDPDRATSIASTEDRLLLMRRFLVEHRKKKQRESRETMRKEMQRLDLISEGLVEAEQRWNSRYQDDHDDRDQFEKQSHHDDEEVTV